MRNAHLFLLVFLACVCAGTGISHAYWLRTLHFSGDADLMRFISEAVFTVEGRIGDRMGPAHELDMGQTTMDLVVTASYNWQNGVPEPFSLSYDRSTGTVAFTLGGETLQYETQHSGFDAVLVRTRAIDAGASAVVDNMWLNGHYVDDQCSVLGPDDRDILLIYGVPIAEGFTFSGVVTLGWTDTPPVDQDLAFLVKVTRSAVVGTEGSTWGAIKSLYR